MNIDVLLQAMTPAVYEKIRQAVETGKWLDGNPLTEDQKESCMQAVMLYQAKIQKSTEHMTVNEQGEIVHKSKSELRQELKNTPQNTIARFNQDDI